MVSTSKTKTMVFGNKIIDKQAIINGKIIENIEEFEYLATNLGQQLLKRNQKENK